MMLCSGGGELLVTHTDKLENQPLSALLDSLINIFTTIPHNGNFLHLQPDGMESLVKRAHYLRELK
jgi:hypothetical protein